MDDFNIIAPTLKYFDFDELCIAERISVYFRCCVKSELNRLKYVDFRRMFTTDYSQILEKLLRYCPNLRKLNNLRSAISTIEHSRILRSETFTDSLRILLFSLQKLAYLEIDFHLLHIFGWENVLSFVESFPYLRQLNAYIDAEKISDNGLLEKVKKVIIGHPALRMLKITWCNDPQIDLSSCRNLTSLALRQYRQLNIHEYDQLYALLDVNSNLRRVAICCVRFDNTTLIKKLMKLQNLESLSLDFQLHRGDSNLSYPASLGGLYFSSLRKISIFCEPTEGHAKLVVFLLAHSPLLKRFELNSEAKELTFYRIIFDNFPLYDRIEYFMTLDCLNCQQQLFIYIQLSKMVNLKYFRVDFDFYIIRRYIQNIGQFDKLKFLSFMPILYHDTQILKQLCSGSSLQGIDLFDFESAPASIDVILDRCPNLRFFSVNVLLARQLRILPLKTPNLQYFRSRRVHDFVLEITVEGLSYVIENLPNLRLLSIDYYLALEYGEYVKIKRLCWRKGISFMHLAGRPNIVDEWFKLCRQEDSSA